MLGIAQGCIGMSREDFVLCTPDEFQEIYDEWFKRDTALMHRGYETARLAAAITLVPYIGTKVPPEKLYPFPWEKEKGNREENDGDGATVPNGTSTEDRAKEMAVRVGWMDQS